MKENPPKQMEVDEGEADDNSDPVQEFQSLNTQIDQLNTVLDVLEKKNDDIQAKLMELLVSSRELRATQSMSSKEAEGS